MRRSFFLYPHCTLAILVAAMAVSDLEGQSPTRKQPNIILINLDDADFEMLSPRNMEIYYPHLKSLASDGIRFTNFHVTTPLCGPSRACLFRGQYAHNTGVRTNDPTEVRSNGFDGGMGYYGMRGYHRDDISTWMKDAGYHTMMIGKYLHSDAVDIVPEGWDDFYSSRGANYFQTTRFTNHDAEAGRGFMEPAEVYRTTQEGSEALMLIDRHVARGEDQPFFMYLAPLAPHQQTPRTNFGMVEPKYMNLWPGALMPLNPAVFEYDFSDKSTAIRDVQNLTPRQMSQVNPRFRQRLLSVKSVDDVYGALVEKLKHLDLMDNTYIILTSDNGFSNGHHRMLGKGDSFNRSTHVPLYVIGPGIPAGTEANHLLAHIDLAPTITDLGQAIASKEVDGKSFVPLLIEPEKHDAPTWRDAIMIENWESRTLSGGEFNTASLALRFYDSVYTEWANGTPGFYDLGKDPNQLTNSWDSLDDSEKDFLHQKLKTFRRTPGPPDTTIYMPFQMNGIHGRKTPITGMAEDDSAIAEVQLVIKRFSDSKFWNGENWQTGHIVLDADITNPDYLLTTWTYRNVPAGQPVDDLLGVWARAKDDTGQFDESVPWVIFRVDSTRPQSTIETPQANEVVDRFVVNGMAADEGGVHELRMVIRNRGTREYWDGEKWCGEWTWFTVPVRRSGRWKFVHEEFEGNFFVSTRAVDVSGNVQSPPAKTTLSVIKN